MTARRTALARPESGPREILERCRQASIDQSVEDMRHAYAADAVHEFPFMLPGVPSRLEGRDEIVDWIAGGWSANPLRYEQYRTLAADNMTRVYVDQSRSSHFSRSSRRKSA